ncbi:MAG TPA: SAM-dependent methyltransferase [Steroidobacteraceae bacterium]|jgi:SAM-dependent MidA family methyltransferase
MTDPAAAAHGRRVQEHVAAQIVAAGGWLSFERFMDLALYAPGLGYYSGGAQKLGAGGDFTTAPEVSGLFGACVAVQCAEVLREVTAAAILEIGAGSGRLAVDLLERLESLQALPQRYLILEISADLRERQRRLLEVRLPQLIDRIQWIDSPPPTPFDGIIIANEVVDALPVARFRWQSGGTQELGVAIDGSNFAWAPRTADAAMAEMCRRLSDAAGGWDEGYVSEYCPRVAAWTLAVAQSLRRGAALWFDYGLPRAQYYLPERHEGTLICHYRHQAHADPFVHVGLQDISAWVDFTLLAEAARAAGFELAGFTTQAYFLAGTGIDREMRRRAGRDENVFARLAGEARQLMMPGEMGERFKAMAWLKGLDIPLSGFALQDLRHTL